MLNIIEQQKLIGQINEKIESGKAFYSDLQKLMDELINNLGPEIEHKLPDLDSPDRPKTVVPATIDPFKCSGCGGSELRPVPVQHVLIHICNDCNLQQ